MKNQFFAGVALAAIVIPGAAFAQSTGTVDAENSTIVVTGARDSKGVNGVVLPDTPKAKGVLTQEAISRVTPGNSILNTINQLPGVSFQNNDPFGSAGGNLSIRGFDSSRIALTFDGIPLNDTGNYALYSNQQLDPELIEEVNVNLGSTDVDSPSAAASGSTVNYRTRKPYEQFGARLTGSVGDYNYFRVFGVVDTGTFGPFGTRAFVAASSATNRWFVNDYGKIDKQQYNAKLYQPLGDNGDFIAISGHYNQNRNNFGGSAPLRYDLTSYPGNTTLRTVGTGSGNRFPLSMSEIPYHVTTCPVVTPVAGTAQSTNSCGTTFDERYNPSNTGNIRINSRFTLAPGLVLTIDPSFQYVKANGGGTVTAREGGRTVGASTNYGFMGGSYYTGVDLNGDGDKLDSVTFIAPSQTRTRRYGVIASLRWDVAPGQSLRIGYAHDYGNHRQTGELGPVDSYGHPYDVFPGNKPLVATNGYVVQKRDRQSIAVLDQISGEYRGKFGALSLLVGIRAPFMKRDLNNYCFTTASNGNVDCLGIGNATDNAAYATANPTYAAPQRRVFNYNRVLPNVGITWRATPEASLFANYSKGIQVPGTDNLYQSFWFAQGSAAANPTPETTDNFDVGFRYVTRRVQFQVGPWFTRFQNRLASAFDEASGTTIYRNLGRVDKYGIDGSISFRPIPELSFYLFGSAIKSEIKNNVSLGTCASTTTANCTAIGQTILAATAGKFESATPTYMFGGRVQGSFGPFDIGLTAKRTGGRYLNDQNLPAMACTSSTGGSQSLTNQLCPTSTTVAGGTALQWQVYDAKSPAYTLVDLDMRLKLGFLGLNDKTYLQLNVQNVFNTYSVGGFNGGSTTVYSIPFAQIGIPRTFIGTLNFQF